MTIIADKYEGCDVKEIGIRVYFLNKKKAKEDRVLVTTNEIIRTLSSILESELTPIPINPPKPRKIRNKKPNYPEPYIPALKESSTAMRPFLVADFETILRDDIHMVYAAGLLMVKPGEELLVDRIETYFPARRPRPTKTGFNRTSLMNPVIWKLRTPLSR